MAKRCAAFAILIVMFLIAGAACEGQINTATIYGTVTDPSKAVIPGTHITLSNEGTGLTKTAVSNGVGEFTLNYIPVGHYTIKIVRDGFEAREIQHIDLNAAQTIEMDFALRLLTVSQTVDVSAAKTTLDFGTAAQLGDIPSNTLNELPVAKQDWTTLLKTSPGVAQISAGDALGGSGIVMNGLPGSSFNLTVDGTNASSQPDLPAFGFYQQPNIINTISNDAIQEVSIVRGIVPASVSGTMSGNINIITKTGTNTFHGDLYEINSLSAYAGALPFSTSKPRSTFNQYGGAISGPIYRNKLFFFGSYEGARLSNFTQISASIPTPYLISVTPAALLPIINSYPVVPAQPPANAQTVNYVENSAKRQKDGSTTARLDYDLSGSDIFTLRYTRARPYSFSPQIIATDPRVTTGHMDAYTGQWIHTWGNWSSNARLGYNRIRLSRNDLGMATDYESFSYNGLSNNGSELLIKAGSVYTTEDGITYTRGRHTIQFGGIVQRQDAGRSDQNATALKYSTLAQFEANTPSQVQITFDITPYALYYIQSGGYIQDDFKVSPSFTLNLGIRYDYWTIPKTLQHGRLFNRGIDPANPQLGPGYGPYLPEKSAYDQTYNNLAPRFGFSWNADSRGNTVVRGGFGIFKNPHTLYGGPISLVQTSATTPLRVTLNQAQTAAAGLQYPVPQSAYATILTQLQTTGVLSPNFSGTTISQHFPNPYSEQWMLGVQRALPWRTILDVSYVGNRGLHENVTETVNLPPRNSTTGLAPVPTLSSFPYYFAGDSSNYHGLQTSLNRTFSHGFTAGANYTYSKALSVEQAGLVLETSPQDNNNLAADYGRAPFDVRNTFYANAVWDIALPHWAQNRGWAAKEVLGGWQFSGVFSANDGFPTTLTDGNSTYPSDRPDMIPGRPQYVKGYSLSSPQYLYPAINPGTNTSVTAASNTAAAFINPVLNPTTSAQIRGGNDSRDGINQPGMWDVDASVAKTFRFTESVKLQLRLDAFDALNHPILGGLVTNTTKVNFGYLTSGTARTMQIGGKISF